MPKKIEPAGGKLLVSEPSLRDRFFNRSVVLLADHGKDGSFGLIINKPAKIRLSEVTDDFTAFDPQIFIGGPVMVDNLYFIHTKGDKVEGSYRIMEGLYWGGDVASIREMMVSGELMENDIRFFAGYSGWAAKQLDSELAQHSWLVMDATPGLVMNLNTRNLWRNLVLSMGEEYAMWVNFPEDPEMN